MACGLVIRVCLLAALASVVNSQEDGSMMRRHNNVKNSQVDLSASGEMHVLKAISRLHAALEDEDSDSDPRSSRQPVQTYLKMQKAGQVHAAKQPGEVSYCDESYVMGTANSNTCLTGIQIIRQEDCKHAAGVLGLKIAADDKWLINENVVNPSTHPKNCFLLDDKVFFNPTDSVRADGWEGQPICSNIIYKNGTSGVDSKASCTGDYEPITSWKECEWAHDCQWGAMYCQEPEFANDHFTTQDAPAGCYRSAIGCYGFNKNTAATGKLTGKTAVCKLKTHTFNEADAAAGAAGKETGAAAAPAAEKEAAATKAKP